MEKYDIICYLRKVQKEYGHIIGLATGSGLMAKNAVDAGCDFIMVNASGRFRQNGFSSLHGYMPYENANDSVMSFAVKEIIPTCENIPIIFGLNAADPTKNMDEYLKLIKRSGFHGISNFPSVGIYSGNFREALENCGLGFQLEVDTIRRAGELGLFTVANIFSKEHYLQMLDAGADMICIDLGVTSGGKFSSQNTLSLKEARETVQSIFSADRPKDKTIFRTFYGGPILTPQDVQFLYSDTTIDGYIGGSSFERIPLEQTVSSLTEAFKEVGSIRHDNLLNKKLSKIDNRNYTEYLLKYISVSYFKRISFTQLANELHFSRAYLGSVFKRDTGYTFSDYLTRFRIQKAADILREQNITVSELSELVGYCDAAQFSKMFSKITGMSPVKYKRKFLKDAGGGEELG